MRKVRVTLDLTTHRRRQLEELVEAVDAGTKASLIREAVNVYQWLFERADDGCEFWATKDGSDPERIVFVGLLSSARGHHEPG